MKHSVIMAAYNAAAYINQSVGSVLSQLGVSDEIIVVDDGSIDATVEMVMQMGDQRIKLLRQENNAGIAAARNRGLEVFSGDYVHFLDHDDLWSAGRLAVLAECLDPPQPPQPPRPDIVSGWVEHFYCESLSADQRAQYYLPPTQAASLPASVVIRREIVQQTGLFDVSLSSGEFVDYLSRAMALSVGWIKLDQVLFLRRIHGNNHTLTDQGSQSAYLSVIRRHMQRRLGRTEQPHLQPHLQPQATQQQLDTQTGVADTESESYPSVNNSGRGDTP